MDGSVLKRASSQRARGIYWFLSLARGLVPIDMLLARGRPLTESRNDDKIPSALRFRPECASVFSPRQRSVLCA